MTLNKLKKFCSKASAKKECKLEMHHIKQEHEQFKKYFIINFYAFIERKTNISIIYKMNYRKY